MNRRNLVFVCTDQLRYDALSATGNRVVRTGNIDRLAEGGIAFHRHHTPNQICSPSRATMATGLYPRHHGLWRNGVALNENIPTLWSVLAGAGYATAAVGKVHYQPLLAPAERDMPESLAYWDRADAERWSGPFYGFGTVELVMGEANEATAAGHYAAWLKSHHPDVVALYEPEASPGTQASDLREVWKSAVPAHLHYTNWIADRAVAAIERCSRGEPFCLFVSFPDPHHPFAPPRPYCDLYDPADMPAPAVVPGELDRMPPYLRNSEDPARAAYIGAGEQMREQGFLLRTDQISASSLATATAHTFGTIRMIDDAVGRITAALDDAGLAEDTYVLFTSDHGELLGDHGLLRKGPPPYRQLLQVPLLLRGPGIAAGAGCHALTSHIDLFPTLLSLLGVPCPTATDGQDLAPVIAGTRDGVRDHLFAEYHPRKDAALYNQSIVTDVWRLTLYPQRPGWGELFDRVEDPWEHRNLFDDAALGPTVQALREVMEAEFAPMPHVPGEVLGAY